MPWVLANWKIIAVAGAFLSTFYAGWHSHSWYDAYHTQKAEIKAIDSLGKGESAIVKFNGDLDKAKSNAKDDCIDRPIPAGVVGLLH